MEDQVITSTTEPTIVESANTSAENTASQVIDQATPMDSNITYSNLPKVEYQPNMSPTQNLINEAVQTEHVVNQETNAGKAMNSFLTQGYDYDKSEAGSYWVAGAINDNNTQMSFLETLINEEMYDEMDLQKYYYDTNLATARAYAAQKGKETAYGFYRAAQERALAEGELTGWYMPAEGRYLLGQYTVAQNTLENPDATPEEISKANRVAKAAESWFSANQITTRGIKCLAMMNYEENVRHNTVMGELQKQANQIAAASAAASAAGNDLQLRELKFQVEEMELQTGYDFSNAIGLDNNDYIGHKREDYPDLQALRGYESTADMLLTDADAYAAVLGAGSKEFIDQVLTQAKKDPEKAYRNYDAQRQTALIKKSIDDNSYYDGSNLYKGGTIKDTKKLKDIGSDKQVYVINSRNGDEIETRLYYKDSKGLYRQITDGDIELKNGNTIKKQYENFNSSELNYNGTKVRVGNAQPYDTSKGSISYNEDAYINMGNKQKETVKKKEAEGYRVLRGYYSTQGIDANVVMEGPDGKVYEVSDTLGSFKEIDRDKHLKKLSYNKYITGSDHIYKSLMKVGEMPSTNKAAPLDGDTSNIFITIDADGNTYYYIDEHRANQHNSYVRVKESEVSKYLDTDKVTSTIANIDAYNNGETSEEIETTKQELKKPKISNSVSSKGSGASQVKTTDYNPEERTAIFKKYNIPLNERPEYKDIKTKDLEEKLKVRYNNILGQGGEHSGK